MTETPTTAWVDGDPLMEAVAAAVWEHCRTEGSSTVVDDPRTIAAVAVGAVRSSAPAAPADASLRDRIAGAIYERFCEGYVWADAHPDDRQAYGDDGDAVLAALRGLTLRELELLYRPNTTPSRPEPRRLADEARQGKDEPGCAHCGHSQARHMGDAHERGCQVCWDSPGNSGWMHRFQGCATVLPVDKAQQPEGVSEVSRLCAALERGRRVALTFEVSGNEFIADQIRTALNVDEPADHELAEGAQR